MYHPPTRPPGGIYLPQFRFVLRLERTIIIIIYYGNAEIAHREGSTHLGQGILVNKMYL